MNERKGFVLPIVFFLIAVLTTELGAIFYFLKIWKENVSITIDVKKALKAAESGVEVALVKLRERIVDNKTEEETGINCTEKGTEIVSCNGTLNSGNDTAVNNATFSVTYNVTYNETSHKYECSITSTGEKNGAIRIVEVKAFVNKTDNNSITIEFWKTY